MTNKSRGTNAQSGQKVPKVVRYGVQESVSVLQNNPEPTIQMSTRNWKPGENLSVPDRTSRGQIRKRSVFSDRQKDGFRWLS